MKRYLYLAHRWMGIVLSLFMAMWFVSGVVMMYVGYPKLTPAEHLASMPALSGADCCIETGVALAAADRKVPPETLRLTTIAGRPHYVLTYAAAPAAVVDALHGEVLGEVTRETALAAASAFATGAQVRYDGLVDEDAWTHSRALDAHRPLHRIEVEDGSRMLLYVSSATGEVVRDATRTERVWNWFGAWIHWLYPFRGGMFDRFWTDIVVYLSLAGTALAVTGIVIGILRWRFGRPYKRGSRSPYVAGFMRWHHLMGLVFGVIAATWIFSGLMSMNPWGVFRSGRAASDAHAYAGGALDAAAFPGDTRDILARFAAADFKPHEIEWRLVNGRAYAIGTGAGGATRIVMPGEPGPVMSSFDEGELVAAAQRFIGSARLVETRWLERYDAYYYDRADHTMTGHVEKRLPALRLVFDDPRHTWLHVDVHTGRVVAQLDSRQRLSRWLFAFLHSFDWPALLAARPLWDALLLVLSAGGAIISVTGVVVGWRRLGRKLRVAG